MKLPTIPTSEYENRKIALQSLMKEYGFDILFFYGDDRAVFGANHTRWISNYSPHFEPILISIPSLTCLVPSFNNSTHNAHNTQE